MKISIIMPTYNEKKTVLKILEKVKNVPIDKEIIIVDDGSTDGTREILNKIKEEGIKIILKENNEGKGAAVREGLKHITGEVVVIQDADLEYEPNDWIEMLKIMEKNNLSVVYGSRILGKGKKSSFFFYLGGRILSFLANFFYNAGITDESTCYKMFKTKVIKEINLKCKGFEFCPEITAKVRKKGYKITEVPISYYPRSVKEGKKIKWKDGIEAIWTLLKYRFIN
ncbi:glycosyl transferase [bacterium Unc6]|nr:glycosyl transferase [bacterium Unc6]